MVTPSAHVWQCIFWHSDNQGCYVHYYLYCVWYHSVSYRLHVYIIEVNYNVCFQSFVVPECVLVADLDCFAALWTKSHLSKRIVCTPPYYPPWTVTTGQEGMIAALVPPSTASIGACTIRTPEIIMPVMSGKLHSIVVSHGFSPTTRSLSLTDV